MQLAQNDPGDGPGPPLTPPLPLAITSAGLERRARPQQWGSRARRLQYWGRGPAEQARRARRPATAATSRRHPARAPPGALAGRPRALPRRRLPPRAPPLGPTRARPAMGRLQRAALRQSPAPRHRGHWRPSAGGGLPLRRPGHWRSGRAWCTCTWFSAARGSAPGSRMSRRSGRAGERRHRAAGRPAGGPRRAGCRVSLPARPCATVGPGRRVGRLAVAPRPAAALRPAGTAAQQHCARAYPVALAARCQAACGVLCQASGAGHMACRHDTPPRVPWTLL